MDDYDLLGLMFCLGLVLIFVLTAIINYADSKRPRYDDRVPRNHRRNTHNGFKSRVGRPYREYR